jgi:hypothetical protein
MPLVQFLITAANNGASFPVLFTGPASIRILSAQAHCTGGAGTSVPFQIRSDTLIFPYSPTRFFTFLTNSQATVTVDSGFQEYHINNCKVNNQMIIQVVDATTGVAPLNFQYCLLTLQVEQMDRQWNPITNTSTPSR